MTRKATSSIPLRPSRWAGRAAVIAGALCAALTGSLLWKASKIPALNVTAADEMSVSVVDRDGRLLRAFTTPSGRWRLPVTAQDVDRRYRDLLLAYEDKRFFDHGGVDALAVLRAGTQLAMNGRIVSGASTLTMQVARLLEGRHDRSFGGKMRQMVHALALERRYSKREILDLYFGLAPFGGNIEGVRAASLAYFGKEPRRLSLGEAALLVALPQSPETRRPDRHPAAAKRARAKVLERARGAGLITSAESARAESEPIPRRRQLFPNYAPHLADRLRVASPAAAQHRTTLNRNLQRRLEDLVHQHAQALGKRLSAAMIVVDHTSGDIVAHVGSPDYFDHSVLGAIDMTGAVRSPGSALKPIVYGMAFERGLAHPQTLIDDRPVRFGTYAPRNFDEDFRGTITIREALGRSLNIPAVKLLDAVGPGRMIGRLRKAGIAVELPEGTTPSLAVALGGVGITLESMARLYTALARGGEPIPLRYDRSVQMDPLGSLKQNQTLLGSVATHYVTDILKDAPPPPNAPKGLIAFKTGTSYGYRDAWAAGYDGRHTIVVWVGRPDAAATPGLMGRTAAAPILFDAFSRVSSRRVRLRQAPPGALAVSGHQLPEPLKRFERDRRFAAGGAYLEEPVRIAFPIDRSEMEVMTDDDGVALKVSGGTLPLTWFANGTPIASRVRDRQLFWPPPASGFVKLSVVDARGRTDRVTVRLRRSPKGGDSQ